MENQVLVTATQSTPPQGVVDHCVEQLCQQGCARVSEYIQALRSGQPVPGTEGLDTAQRQLLLVELESIMSVYQCSCDGR